MTSIPLSSLADKMPSLLEATANGDVDRLKSLIDESPQLISNIQGRILKTTTPLHVSAWYGQLAITKHLLDQYPWMATETDFSGGIPLHVASAEGHVDVVKALLDRSVDPCLYEDKGGRIPLHWAVMRGSLPVIEELLSACPESLYVLLEGDTVLHLAVKYLPLPALEKLFPLVRKGYNAGIFSQGNREGNTILHLAVLLKRTQTETLEYILSLPEIRSTAKKTLNNDGYNALEAYKNHSLSEEFDIDHMKIEKLLKDAGLWCRWDAVLPPDKPWWYRKIYLPFMQWLYKACKEQAKWIHEARGQLLVVASIVTTITFQVAVNPPGGVFQFSMDDLNNNKTMTWLNHNKQCQGSFKFFSKNDGYGKYNEKCQLPGNAVMWFFEHTAYGILTVFNTGAFFGSTSISFILATGLPLSHPLSLVLFNLAVGLTIVFLMLTFIICVYLTNPMFPPTVFGTIELVETSINTGILELVVIFVGLVFCWWVVWGPNYSKIAKLLKTRIDKQALPRSAPS